MSAPTAIHARCAGFVLDNRLVHADVEELILVRDPALSPRAHENRSGDEIRPHATADSASKLDSGAAIVRERFSAVKPDRFRTGAVRIRLFTHASRIILVFFSFFLGARGGLG